MFKNLSPGAVGIKATTQQAIHLAATCGFQGVDLNINEAAESVDKGELDRYRAAFRSRGIVPGGWGLPVDFRRDDATFERDLAGLARLAQAADAMDCRRAFTYLLPFSDTLTYKENFALHRQRFVRITAVLVRHNIRLGLEFVGPKPVRDGHRYEFIYRMDQMLELCDAVGTGNLGLLLDCYHWHTSGGTLDEIRRLRPEQVVYVHVNDAAPDLPPDELPDSPRRLPGETGVIDLVGFLGALKTINYDGPVTPEPFDASLGTLPPEKAARKVADAMNRTWAAAGL